MLPPSRLVAARAGLGAVEKAFSGRAGRTVAWGADRWSAGGGFKTAMVRLSCEVVTGRDGGCGRQVDQYRRDIEFDDGTSGGRGGSTRWPTRDERAEIRGPRSWKTGGCEKRAWGVAGDAVPSSTRCSRRRRGMRRIATPRRRWSRGGSVVAVLRAVSRRQSAVGGVLDDLHVGQGAHPLGFVDLVLSEEPVARTVLVGACSRQ